MPHRKKKRDFARAELAELRKRLADAEAALTCKRCRGTGTCEIDGRDSYPCPDCSAARDEARATRERKETP